MRSVNSIQAIDKVFETGEQPVLVLCDDLKSYICKYSRWSSGLYRLLCEFIGNKFAQQWHFSLPECILVDIKDEHVNNGLSPAFFKAKSLGIEYLRNVTDLTHLTDDIPASGRYIPRLFDQLLQIALFDIWLANEDRNANNYNLLLNVEEYILIPIDFGMIFNSSSFDISLSPLTEFDSIITSSLYMNLHESNPNFFTAGYWNELNEYYKSSIERCRGDVENILNEIPAEWEIDVNKVRDKLTTELFSDEWISSSFELFKSLLLHK